VQPSASATIELRLSLYPVHRGDRFTTGPSIPIRPGLAVSSGLQGILRLAIELETLIKTNRTSSLGCFEVALMLAVALLLFD
jgi:hypothetical protein